MHKTTKSKRVEIVCITMRDFACCKKCLADSEPWAFEHSDVRILIYTLRIYNIQYIYKTKYIHHTLIIDDNRYENTLNKFFTVKIGAKTFSNQPKKKRRKLLHLWHVLYAQRLTIQPMEEKWRVDFLGFTVGERNIEQLFWIFFSPTVKIQNLILIKHDWYFAFWQTNSCFFLFDITKWFRLN